MTQFEEGLLKLLSRISGWLSWIAFWLFLLVLVQCSKGGG